MKNLKNLGHALTKTEQRMIRGGQELFISKCGARCTGNTTGCHYCSAHANHPAGYYKRIIPPNG